MKKQIRSIKNMPYKERIWIMNNVDINHENTLTKTPISSVDNIKKQKLNLIVELYYSENDKTKNIYISLWIGFLKFYKINNLDTFFKIYLNNWESLKLNDKFTYSFGEHTFSIKDKNILKLLSQCYSSSFNKDDCGEFKSHNKVFLTNNTTLHLLKLLDKKKFLFNKDKNREKTYIKNENMPLSFNIKKSSSFLIVNHSENTPIALTENGEFFYFNKVIYSPTISQREAYMPIYKKFASSKKNSISIYKNLDETTFNSFFESIDKCGVSVIVKDKFWNDTNKDSLKARFYLDFSLGKIILNVRFLYDRMEVNPFDTKKYIACQIVKNRNLKKEYYIFDIIKGLNFEMTNLCFILEDTNAIREFIQKGFLQLEEFGEIHRTDSFIDCLAQN